MKFRFANITGPREIKKDKDQNLKLENLNKEIEAILDKYPNGFSIDEIVNEEIKEDNDYAKNQLRTEIMTFLSETRGKKREQYEEDNSPEKIMEKLIENEFDKQKEFLNEDLINKIKRDYNSDKPNKTEKHSNYYLAIAATKLAEIMLHNLGIKINKVNTGYWKDKFIEFYKNKKNQEKEERERNKHKYKPPENIRNFYEVEKPDEE